MRCPDFKKIIEGPQNTELISFKKKSEETAINLLLCACDCYTVVCKGLGTLGNSFHFCSFVI